MPLPKGMKNALGRRAGGMVGAPVGKAGISPMSGDMEGDSLSGLGPSGKRPFGGTGGGLPNKPVNRASGGKGGPKVIGNGLGPAPSQMESPTAKIGSMPGMSGGAIKSPNAKASTDSIPGGLSLGSGQNQNGRPTPEAMARRIGKPAFGGAKGLPGGLNLGRGQEEHGRATAKKGNVLGKVGGSGFGGTARQPGDPADRKPGGIGGSKIGPGSFAPHPGISKLSPNNTGKPGSMLKGPKFPKGVPFGKNVK